MILVTGGTGFIGSTLIHQLLAAGRGVRAIRRHGSVIPSGLTDHPQLQWADADITDYFALEDAFSGVTQVYHCAAMISNDPGDRKQLRKVNVEGTAHIVTLCMQHQARLLHVSSIATIGPSPDGTESTENDVWKNDGRPSGYSISKYLAEMEVWKGIAEGLHAVIVNPSLVIGSAAGGKGTGAIFSLLQKGFDFYPPGSVGLVDVEDVARAMILLMEQEGVQAERFIVSNENWSYQDLFSRFSVYLNRQPPRRALTRFMLGVAWRISGLIALLSGKRPSITRESARASQKKLAYSNHKIRQQTGLVFKPIDTTLREISSAIQSHL